MIGSVISEMNGGGKEFSSLEVKLHETVAKLNRKNKDLTDKLDASRNEVQRLMRLLGKCHTVMDSCGVLDMYCEDCDNWWDSDCESCCDKCGKENKDCQSMFDIEKLAKEASKNGLPEVRNDN